MTAIKPMLAHSKTPDLNTLTYPLLVQPKYDGIRCMIVDGVALSRTAKPIRNAEIQAALGHPWFDGLDGELLVGSPCANDAMQRSSEFVMSSSKTGAPWAFYVFDNWFVSDLPYKDRIARSMAVIDAARSAGVSCSRFESVPSFIAHSADDVSAHEAVFVAEGYEGAILRDPRAPYKHGRSGSRGPLLKLKRWTDAEAEVIGVNEMMRNENENVRDAFGRSKRSTAKAGLVPAGVLGNLRCRTPEGVEFEIGTGFTAAQRAELWADHLGTSGRMPLIGLLAKYKYVEVGVKDAPRFPTFLGFRDPDDM